MKKIFIGKNDDPAFVVENILGEKEKDLVIVLPKSSKLAGSVSNFHLIKREADADNKNLVIESVDEEVLALAQAAGIASLNPFLSGRRKSMSDIIAPEISLAGSAPSSLKKEEARLEEETIPEENSDVTVDFTEKGFNRKTGKFSKKKAYFFIGALVLIALIWVGVENVSPKATIAFTLKEYPFESKNSLSVETDSSDIDLEKSVIGGELFTERKNITLNFPASGSKKIERKAKGKVIIYNAYSSQSQILVASTRLLAPDGKLFRLVNKITVPGAKIEQGKIIPSSIEAEIIADKAGEEYNIGPISRFSIPGFQGSSKYESFYGESKEPATGGFIGVAAFPTDADKKEAITKIEQTLKDSLASSLNIPEDFTAIDGSDSFKIVKTEVKEETNEKGEFSVYGEVEKKVLAFSKKQLEEFLVKEISENLGFKVNLLEYALNPKDVKIDFETGKMTFLPSASGLAQRDLNIDEFKNGIKGKNSSELKAEIISTVGVENARISFWPFWVDKVPENSEKINVSFEK
ncbi:MAG: hypothetical protein WC435_03010 [Candidatus Paceibacterota bacterium]